jgi:hypothetical protein
MSEIKVKRLLALIKSEIELDRDHNLRLPKGFKRSFEIQKHFKGWINYHVTWDVHPEDPWRVIPLNKSLEEQWHDELEKVVPVITPEGIVEAEEWEKRSASMK